MKSRSAWLQRRESERGGMNRGERMRASGMKGKGERLEGSVRERERETTWLGKIGVLDKSTGGRVWAWGNERGGEKTASFGTMGRVLDKCIIGRV